MPRGEDTSKHPARQVGRQEDHWPGPDRYGNPQTAKEALLAEKLQADYERGDLAGQDDY